MTTSTNADTRPASEIADALAAGDTTSVEVTQAHLDRIGEVDGAVHAFLQVDAEGALRDAARRGNDAVRGLGA